MLRFLLAGACLTLCSAALYAQTAAHVWEMREIELRSARTYANPYTEVDCWVELRGPGFSRRVYGFENEARGGRAAGWIPNGAYRFTWYNPRTGEWQPSSTVTADARGELELPRFPGNAEVSGTDWAAKILMAGRGK